jgi:Icc-related predicted phosphoesterase
MKVLAVADTVERGLYDHFNSGHWQKAGIELIVSCGDLKPGYLDFLVSVFNVPCYYVRGNHDVTYAESPPGGCVDLHERVQRFKGVAFFGLEGSHWYNGGPAQYTERQMRWKTFWARPALRQAGGADVFVAHSAPRMCPLPAKRCVCVYPPPGVGPVPVGEPCAVEPERKNWDMADLPHRGFDALRQIVLKYQPRFLLHGHTHLGYGTRPRELTIGRTRVIDVYGHVVLDV